MFCKTAKLGIENVNLSQKVSQRDQEYIRAKIDEYLFRIIDLVDSRATSKMEVPNIDCIAYVATQVQNIRLVMNFRSFVFSSQSVESDNKFIATIISKVYAISNENKKQKVIEHLNITGKALLDLITKMKKIDAVFDMKANDRFGFFDDLQHYLINSISFLNICLNLLKEDGLIKNLKKIEKITAELEQFLSKKNCKQDVKNRKSKDVVLFKRLVRERKEYSFNKDNI